MSRRGVKLYLQDILDSINKITEYTQGLTYESFSKDEKTIDAVVRNLEIIGEAAKNVPSEVTGRYNDVNWEKMVSMRNKIMHEYFGIDVEILWQTIRENLPELKEQIQKLADIF